MALALVVGFYVLAVALIAALVFVIIVSSAVWTVLCALLAALVAALVFSVSRFKPVVPAGPSFPVDPERQPEFWALVRDVAGEAGSRPPDEITLVSVADLALLEDAQFLGLRRGRRVLLIGIPVLGGLSIAQLRATLVQEFARDSFGWRARQQVDRAVASTRRTRLIGGFFAGFAKLFRAAAGKSARERIAHADAEAARRTGRSTVLAALRMRVAVAAAWPEFAANHLTDTTQFADAFREFIEERDPVADPDPARTAAIEALPDTPGEDDGTPASSLLESADLN